MIERMERIEMTHLILGTKTRDEEIKIFNKKKAHKKIATIHSTNDMCSSKDYCT